MTPRSAFPPILEKPWPRHSIRNVSCLDGVWDFAFVGEGDRASFAKNPRRYLPRSWSPMAVPGAFDAMPEWIGKRGLAWYRKSIRVPSGSRAVLDFDAVSMACVVLVDGVAVTEHRGGFDPFRVEIPRSPGEVRELLVLVDNRFGDSIPLHDVYYDFYQWGGIIRSVHLSLLPEIFLDRVEVTPLDLKGRVSLAVAVDGTKAGPVPLELRFDDGKVERFSVDLTGGVGRIERKVPGAKVWSPASPHLHRLSLRLADGSDDMEVRFGIRTVATKGRDILLNGRKIRWKGYNRHEVHPTFGPAVPTSQMVMDLQLLRRLGCNFVRGSHYPQDQRFLDLCDEAGILVWEETLGWQQHARHLTSREYLADHRIQTENMIRRSFNHPCVVVWGFFNEGDSDLPEGVAAYREVAAQIRGRDASRLLTFATHRPKTDLNLDLVDVVCVNTYPGWYGSENVEDPLSLIAPRMKDITAWIEERGGGKKPLVISEIGAEGMYGWRDAMGSFHSESFQASYLEESIRSVLSDARYAGILLWHFADARTYQSGHALGRPRAYNNKGTFDEYRRPKEAFQKVREAFFKKH